MIMSETKNKKILILGAGGHGKVCADCAGLTMRYNEIAFLDDNLKGMQVLGYEVLGSFSDLINFKDYFDEFFIAVGNNILRTSWIQKLYDVKLSPTVLIHPDSTVSNFAVIGAGSIILAGAVVNANAVLKEGVIVNSRAVVEHDCILEKGVHISPGAIIAGESNIGENTWVCLGARVSNNVNIGNNCIIAANSTVLKDLPDNVMAAGTPAKIKKEFV